MASYPKVDKQDHRAKDSSDYVGNFVLTSHFIHTILTFVDKIAASCINCHIVIQDTLAFESGLDFFNELLLAAWHMTMSSSSAPGHWGCPSHRRSGWRQIFSDVQGK